jgi:hypothetical protein
MGNQNLFFAELASHSPQQPVSITPCKDTQYVLTPPTVITRSNSVGLTFVLVGFPLALVFASMSLAQDPVKADLEAS